jgi:hypothetical protein
VPLLFVSALLLQVAAVQPGEYSERSLCHLWAGARCHATSCQPDAKQQCLRDSQVCSGRGAAAVEQARAERMAACARAMLNAKCGDPAPQECAGVSTP